MPHSSHPTINRRYRVVQIVGTGGQGTVLRVVDGRDGDRPKALKILHGSVDALIRLEFSRAKGVVHPHLVRVFDLGRITEIEGGDGPKPGSWFFTQEWVEGSASHEWIAGAADRPEAAIAVGVAVASALESLHRGGLLHRDVKPDNILVGDDGRTVKLIDLGLAAPRHASPTARGGTLGFAAEEALQGYADERSDIYSLGVTLTALVTGRPPRLLFPPYPGGFGALANLDSAPDLAAVLERMCDSRPERRYPTAQEVADALARAAGGRHLRFEQIETPETPRSPVLKSAPRLAGRTALQGRIETWLTAPNGPGAALLLLGPPGVGKSRLFDTAVTARQIRDAAEGNAPAELLSGTLRELARTLHGASAGEETAVERWLGAETGHAAEAGDEETLVTQIASLFCRAARPAVFRISDDDTPLSRKTVARLDRMPDTDGLKVALELQSTAAETDSETAVLTTIEVPPLTVEELSLLAQQFFGRAPSEAFTAKLHRATAGIPLLAEAILAPLLTEMSPEAAEAADLDGLTSKDGPLDAVVAAALRTMSPDEREAVETLSVASRVSTVEAKAAVLPASVDGATPDRIAAALAQLEKRGWTEMGEETVRLKRAYVEPVRRRLAPDRLRTLHRRALALLDGEKDAPPWEIADHAAGADLPDRARPAAVEAYRRLSDAGDLRGAADYLSLALSLDAFPNFETAEKTLTLAALLRRTGAYDRALETVSTAAVTDSPLREKALLERARILRLQGQTDEAWASLKPLCESKHADIRIDATAASARMALDRGDIEGAKSRVAALRPLLADAPDSPELFATLGLVALSTGDREIAEETFERGLADATTAGDRRNRARFHGLLGMVRHTEGDFTTAADRYETAGQLAAKAGDRHAAATYAVNLGAAYTELGRMSDALDAYRAGAAGMGIFGRPAERMQAGANYAELLFRLGDLREADAVSREILSDAARSKVPPPTSLLCVRGDILREAGRSEEAEQVLREALDRAEKEDAPIEQTAARLHLANLALETGFPERADLFLAETDDAPLRESEALRLEFLRLKLRVADRKGGDVVDAYEKLRTAVRAAERADTDVRLKAAALTAGFADRLGRREEAEEAVRLTEQIAADVHRRTPPVYRTPEPPFHREMQMILNADTTESARRSPPSEWEHLARINTRLNSEFRIRRLLEMIMDAALDITGAERGFLLIAGPSDALKIQCARNMDKESLSLDQSGFSRTAALRAFETGEPLLTTDASDDERFDTMKSVSHFNLRYIAAVPLSVDGKPQGTIYLDSKRAGRFDDSKLALLEALADQAAIALTNARLRHEVRRRQERIERLNRKLAGELKRREGELTAVKERLKTQTAALIEKYRYKEIIARSKPMLQVFHRMDKVAISDFPVLIGGESGTGKELAARAIHFNSPRKKKPFVAENCAAIPEPLLESVLFGHIRGAFTGAVADNRGLFLEADGGTLFLDEVSELSLAMQAKLLRVLQNNEIRAVGATKSRIVNVRIIAATNANLKDRVRAGTFREDLFYRLNVIDIALPPLRERHEDILLLAEHFLQKHGKTGQAITGDAAKILLDYNWPGNVRQLENEIIRASILADDTIGPEHLSPELVSGLTAPLLTDETLDLNTQVDALKRRLVVTALSRCNGNRTAAAELLGISRYGLQKMTKRLSVSVEE